MPDFKYMVFGGGGAAGYAYVGALQQLARQPDFSFNSITAVAGSSVGALAALVVSLNYSPLEASEVLAKLDLKKLADGGCYTARIFRLFTHYGMYKGETFADFVHNIIKEKTGRNDPENVTFADLRELGFKDLHVVATKLYKANDVPTGKVKIFSAEKTPHTSVAAAIRASAAAPIFFSRIRLKKIEKGRYVLDANGDLYDDGGVLNNFPIELFDKPAFMKIREGECNPVNERTLGIALYSSQSQNKDDKPQKTPIADAQPLVFAEGIFNSLLHQVNHTKLNSQENIARTIRIDRKNVKLDDFNMSEEKKNELIASGKEAVKTFFAARTAVNDRALQETTRNVALRALKAG